MKEVNEKTMEDILLEAGLITHDKLKKLRERKARTGEKIESILLAENTSNYREILGMVARRMGVDFVDLEAIKVNKDAIGCITHDVARKYRVFPFDARDNLLFLAMQNPDEIFLIDEIKVYAQMEIKPFLADSRVIDKAISCFYSGRPFPDNSNNKAGEGSTGKPAANFCGKHDEDCEGAVSGIDAAIRAIILKAVKVNASDVHLDKMNGRLRIRYRIDGRLLEESDTVPASPDDILVNIKVMAGLLAGDRSLPVKGRICYGLGKKESVYMDVHMLPAVSGDKLLLKIDRRRLAYTLDKLGMTAQELNMTEAMLAKKRGMIIVTGPGGGGRTSTAYAMLRKLLQGKLNIITVERKVIERIQGISQFQLPEKTEEGVPEILKSIAEHDADVIMADIGFDADVFKCLASISLGGRLVIMTAGFLNTFDALSGLINSGIEPYLISSSIEGIISQCLTRTFCPKCRGRSASRNVPCAECDSSGYKGKTGIFEVFGMNSEYRKALLKGGSLEDLESMLENGKSTLKGNCIKLVNNEVTSIEELISVGVGREMFKS